MLQLLKEVSLSKLQSLKLLACKFKANLQFSLWLAIQGNSITANCENRSLLVKQILPGGLVLAFRVPTDSPFFETAIFFEEFLSFTVSQCGFNCVTHQSLVTSLVRPDCVPPTKDLHLCRSMARKPGTEIRLFICFLWPGLRFSNLDKEKSPSKLTIKI